MPSLNQAAFVPGTTNYQFGYDSIPNIPLTGTPADANLLRFAMLYDSNTYRFYCFEGSSNNSIYQAAFNGTAYAFGYNSIPKLTLTNFPADTDASSFAMLWDGANYRLYLRQLGNPQLLYQAAYVPGSTEYKYGYNSIPSIPITGFPADTDWHRWSMLYDGSAYRIYAFKIGSTTQFYQGSYNAAAGAYQYAFNSIPVLTLVDTPANSILSGMAMLNDRSAYRFYYRVA